MKTTFEKWYNTTARSVRETIGSREEALVKKAFNEGLKIAAEEVQEDSTYTCRHITVTNILKHTYQRGLYNE
jgi:hypothetical protein